MTPNSQSCSAHSQRSEQKVIVSMDEGTESWIYNFVRAKGNEYFCAVDPEFISDRFNLTNLSVENMHDALDLILSENVSSEVSPELESTAAHLYGMIHARYIITSRGLYKMMEKSHSCDFGRCPRALCRSQAMLPVGLHDAPRLAHVKLYCPKCEDIYHPKSVRNSQIDGAYFGTSFVGMFLQGFPKLTPRHTNEQFVLKVFGFKLHDHAESARWQQRQREEMEKRLEARGIRKS